MNDDILRKLLAQGAAPGVGGLWSTGRLGVAAPQHGRPPLTGGLQQMDMLRAYMNGASNPQLQRMNPYTPRPNQFLPSPIPFYSWANDPNNPANKPGADGGNPPPGGVPQVGADGPGSGANDGQDGGAAAGVAGGNDAAAGATGAGAGSSAK